MKTNLQRSKVRGKYNEILTKNIGKNTTISGWTFIGEKVKIGKQCRFGNFVNIDKGSKIGNKVNIQPGTIITNYSKIGNNVFIGAGVMFVDEKYPTNNPDKKIRRPIILEDNCIIGTDVKIVCSRIGKNSVVGTGSLVLEDIPPNQVWVGRPAKPLVIKKNGKEKIMTRKKFNSKRKKM